MLIEQVLKTEVELKSAVTPPSTGLLRQEHRRNFRSRSRSAFQSISIVPPLKPTAEQARNAKKKGEDALRQAKATKSYQDFGLLAEKISEDDFRVNMGDHKAWPRQVAAAVVKALRAMQPGKSAGLIQIESAYTISG